MIDNDDDNDNEEEFVVCEFHIYTLNCALHLKLYSYIQSKSNGQDPDEKLACTNLKDNQYTDFVHLNMITFRQYDASLPEIGFVQWRHLFYNCPIGL